MTLDGENQFGKRCAALLAAALMVLPGIALAQRHGPGGYTHGGGYHSGRPGYGGHYPGAGWRGGYWYHGGYGGHFGWWWAGGDSWYLYPGPVYPYPDVAQAPTYVVPAPAQQQDAAAAPQVWYWCAAPEGYYPYVEQCSVAWQTVIAPPSAAADDQTDQAGPAPAPDDERAPMSAPQQAMPAPDQSYEPLQPLPSPDDAPPPP